MLPNESHHSSSPLAAVNGGCLVCGGVLKFLFLLQCNKLKIDAHHVKCMMQLEKNLSLICIFLKLETGINTLICFLLLGAVD